MSFRERLASANDAARQARDEGKEQREYDRLRLKSDLGEAKRVRTETDEANREAYADRKEQLEVEKDERLSRQRITDGTCPNCGGQQFTAKRSVKGKIAGGLLAPKTQVRCVTCGQMFRRG